MLGLHIKKTIRNPVLIIPILITFIVFLYYLLTDSIRAEEGLYIEGGIDTVFILMPYLFFLFLIISYEMFYSYNKTGFSEMICSNGINFRCQKYDFIILFLINIVMTILVFFRLVVYWKEKGMNGFYLFYYSAKVSIIYVFFVVLFAVLAGWCVSCIKNRVLGICILLVVFYCFDYRFIGDFLALSYDNYSVYKTATLFCLFNIQEVPGFVDPYYPISIEIINIYRAWVWILFTISIIFLLGKKRIGAIISFMCTVVCLALYFQPSGASYDMFVYSAFDKIRGAQYYYGFESEERVESDEKNYLSKNKDDFEVLDYRMELKITDILNAKVTMDVSNSDLEIYQFTLYHLYKVKSITNQDGKELSYKQDGDYIEIKNNGEKIASVTMEYEGADQLFYSTSQGIVLPANFEYYPVAGWKKVFLFDQSNDCFTTELMEKNIDCDLKLYTSKRMNVYANFEEKDRKEENHFMYYHFAGNGNGLTIVGSPFLREKNWNGLRIIYSCLDENKPEAFEYEEYEEDYYDLFKYAEEKNISLEGKTFFVTPALNCGNCCFASDHFVDSSAGDFLYDYDTFLEQGNVYHIITDEERQELEELERQMEEEMQMEEAE